MWTSTFTTRSSPRPISASMSRDRGHDELGLRRHITQHFLATGYVRSDNAGNEGVVAVGDDSG